MNSRKIQRSGTTYYLYLPASWCREHNISTDSVVHLEKSTKGDLVVHPKKTDATLSSLKIDLNENSPEVINKMILASYINPVKKFSINLQNSINSDQILNHKKLLGGLEFVDFEENNVSCHTSLALSDTDILLMSMIKKIINITKLMKEQGDHDLIQRYEEEIDKAKVLISKSIIASLMYRRESKMRHIELYYIGTISRNLEKMSDILITIEKDMDLINTIESRMELLLEVLNDLSQQNVVEFIKSVEALEIVNVKDIETYKKKRIYSHLGRISEFLCDWLVTNIVDNEDN